MQMTRVPFLIQEDPTCRGATKCVHHSYWARAPEPRSCNCWSLCTLEPVLLSKRSHTSEKLTDHNGRVAPHSLNSIQLSHSVVSDFLWPHGPQHARPPCPPPTPRDYSNSCPLSQWCHPAISSSVIPFSSHLQSLPTSGSFQISQLFASGGQSIGVSASTSVLPMNVQDWSPLGWTGWISLQSKGLSGVFSNTTVQKHQFFGTQLSELSPLTATREKPKHKEDLTQPKTYN